MDNTNKQASDPITPEIHHNDSAEESYKDSFLRLNADFQNFKRRVEKEKSEWMLIAQTHILEKFVSIFDELDRAITLAQAQSTQDNKSWIDGLVLMQKQWQKTLTELGVEEVDTTGMFDPSRHEALVQVEDPDKTSGSVVAVFHKGYSYRDKIIKHAKVSVAR